MKATMTDLRYRTKHLLRLVDRGEMIAISYHGKPWAILAPPYAAASKKKSATKSKKQRRSR